MAYNLKKDLGINGDWLSINVEASNTVTGLGIAVTIQGGVVAEVFSPLLIESNLGFLVNVDFSWVFKWHTKLTSKAFGAMKVRDDELDLFSRDFNTKLIAARSQHTRQSAVADRVRNVAADAHITQMEQVVRGQEGRITAATQTAVTALGDDMEGMLRRVQGTAQEVITQASTAVGELDIQTAAMNTVAATVTENRATITAAAASRLQTALVVCHQ